MAFDRTLAREFGFTQEELEANRAGRLTGEQELIIRNAAAYTRRRMPRIKVGIALVFAGALVLVAYGISVTPGGGTTTGVVAAVILAWVGALVMWGMGRNRRHQRDLDDPRILTAEGEVDFEPVAFDSSMGSMYHLLIDDTKLSVTASQMDAMTAGARYRVYFLKTSIGVPTPSSLERADL